MSVDCNDKNIGFAFWCLNFFSLYNNPFLMYLMKPSICEGLEKNKQTVVSPLS